LGSGAGSVHLTVCVQYMTLPHPVVIPLDPSLVLRKTQSPLPEDE
jgi:hypothetical protein